MIVTYDILLHKRYWVFQNNWIQFTDVNLCTCSVMLKHPIRLEQMFLLQSNFLPHLVRVQSETFFYLSFLNRPRSRWSHYHDPIDLKLYLGLGMTCVLENLLKFAGKRWCWGFFFIEVASCHFNKQERFFSFWFC